MGIFDKLKKKIDKDDDDLDELDSDAGEDDEDAPSASFGGGAMGRAMGLLTKVKQLSSSSSGEHGGGIGALLDKVKGLSGRLKDTGDLDLDDDDYDDNSGNTTPEDLAALDASPGDADEERPIRRSGIAAKLDGNSGSDKPAKDEDEEEPIPVPVGLGGGVDFESLFEEDFVINPTLRDLAESLDDVSAVELAADLRTFLEELQ